MIQAKSTKCTYAFICLTLNTGKSLKGLPPKFLGQALFKF